MCSIGSSSESAIGSAATGSIGGANSIGGAPTPRGSTLLGARRTLSGGPSTVLGGGVGGGVRDRGPIPGRPGKQNEL